MMWLEVILVSLALGAWPLPATEPVAANDDVPTSETAAQAPTSETAAQALPWHGTLEFRGQELTVIEALRFADSQSPEIRSGELRQEQTEDQLTSLRSGYFPSVDIGFYHSWGLPATPTGFPIYGVGQNPYKQGDGIGFWSRLSLFDMTREYGLLEGNRRRDAAGFRLKAVRNRVYQTVLQTYFDAARFRSYLVTYQRMGEEIDLFLKLVRRMVNGGQHSPVSLMLLQDQQLETALRFQVYRERYRSAVKRLGYLIGRDGAAITTPPAIDLDESVLGGILTGTVSPVIEQAQQEYLAARAAADKAFAEHYPKFLWFGSVGQVSDVRFNVGKNDYATGFAFVLPIFEGFRIQGEADRQRAISLERESDVRSARLAVDDQNARLDEVIASARAQIRLLQAERELGERALTLAKERYSGFLGTMADIREGIRNLIRVETSLDDAKTDLLNAVASQRLLNGGSLRVN